MAKNFDFSGVWRSVGHYTSSTTSGSLAREEDVKIYRAGNQIIIQTLPNPQEFYMLMRLTQDERILTGTWHLHTAQDQEEKGVNYYGAIQLVIDEDGNALRGKYVGYDRSMQVKSNDWEIVRKK